MDCHPGLPFPSLHLYQLKISIMEEQLILSVDLYENALTEKQGDYTGKPRITGTLRNPDIAF